jgi:2-C-methyl-D-erythritol 2,4-cyclodiphosphate synthase
MDAILGALGKGDIGRHFPDSDPAYLDADSMELLSAVVELARENGFGVNNVDSTIVAQLPRLSPYIDRMRERLAGVLGVPGERVNIKATTTEGLGYCGSGEAMEAFAVVSLVTLNP